jgi:hypothetical protein
MVAVQPEVAVHGEPPRRSSRTARLPASAPHVLGVAWLVGAALAVLGPALVHGASIYDPLSFDQVDELIPWSSLAWTQVHHGQLPLWNPYSVLGMPLAFNWQSAPFGIPAIVGYLFPLHMAYTVQLVTTLIVAGTGVYVLGRVLGLGVLGCVMAGTVYELSGPLVAWLGWPVASVMSWAGWLFAAAILVVRGRHRARAVALLAVVVACAAYAGQPDALVLLGTALVVFLAVLLVLRSRWLGGSGAVLHPVIDVVAAAAAGTALAAPLLLPGTQLVQGATRRKIPLQVLSLHDLVSVVIPRFDGNPVVPGLWFGGSYTESAAYVGVIVVVLAVAAVAVRWRQREVLALVALAVAMAALTFFSPLTAALPSGIRWHRAVIVVAFVFAVLAGVGTDLLVRRFTAPPVRAWVGGGFAGAGLVVAGLWAVGRGHLPPAQAVVRSESFIWPTVEVAVGLAVVGAMVVVHRRTSPDPGRGWLGVAPGRWAGAALVLCETAFLVVAGAGLWFSNTSAYLAPTPTQVALQRAVGGSVLGFGASVCFPQSLGIPQDINVLDGVHELAIYDPVTPRAYFQSWKAATGRYGGIGSGVTSIFCPAVTSATLARRYGVAFVIQPSATPPPRGAVADEKLGDEELYRIPGAAAATVTPVPRSGRFPGVDARGTPVAVAHPDPASWHLVTDATRPQVLRLRLTDVPGWHATLDGRPLALQKYAGVMLQAKVPAGRHTVDVHYWPESFTLGLALAACSAVALGATLMAGAMRRRARASGR